MLHRSPVAVAAALAVLALLVSDRARSAGSGQGECRPERLRRDPGRLPLAGDVRRLRRRAQHQGGGRGCRPESAGPAFRPSDPGSATRSSSPLPLECRRARGPDPRRPHEAEPGPGDESPLVLLPGIQRDAHRRRGCAHRQQRQEAQPEPHRPRVAERAIRLRRAGRGVRLLGRPPLHRGRRPLAIDRQRRWSRGQGRSDRAGAAA